MTNMPGTFKSAIASTVILLGAAEGRAQTDLDVWPTGVNGKQEWPHELSNSWSNPSTNYVYPEAALPPPPDDLLTARIKCREGTKVKSKNQNSAPWETSRWHPPEYAFDNYSMSRWSSNTRKDNWLAADLGTVKKVNQVFLIWDAAYGKDYDIQFSNDSTQWTTAKEVRGQNGRADVVDLNGSGRFIRMWGMDVFNIQWGYSLYEFTICEAGATSVGTEMAHKAAQKSWILVMDARGLPQGVKAVDASGRVNKSRP